MSLLSLFMKKDDKLSMEDWTHEERENLIGFYELLLEVDRRNNPHLHTKNRPLEKVGIDK